MGISRGDKEATGASLDHALQPRKRASVIFILPAFNEAINLEPLVEKIAALSPSLPDYRILIVDDGSRDATPEVAAALQTRFPVRHLRHSQNMGLHRTIWDGLQWAAASASPEDILVTMDADNTHEPYHVLDMLPWLEQGYDVVIASRYQPGAQEIGLTASRRVLSRTCNLLLKALMPMPGVRDYTCGFRAYRARVIQEALRAYGDRFVQATTFAAMAEILLKLRPLGVRTAEVPLVLRYDQKGGMSKMRVARTIADYARVLWCAWRTRPDMTKSTADIPIPLPATLLEEAWTVDRADSV